LAVGFAAIEGNLELRGALQNFVNHRALHVAAAVYQTERFAFAGAGFSADRAGADCETKILNPMLLAGNDDAIEFV